MNQTLNKNKIKQIINQTPSDKFGEITNILIDEIPVCHYEKVICKIKDITGILKIDKESLKETENYIKNAFKEIEKGNICFNCYSYPNGSYSYYDEDYDIHYYSNEEMDEILDKTFEFGKSLIYHKEYHKAIKILEKILNTKYFCEEVIGPEYAEHGEVIDTFETDIENLNDSLDFDLNIVKLFIVYGLLVTENYDNFQKIYDYLSYYHLKDSLKLGIEEIKDIDLFLTKWIQFLKTKNTQKSKILLNEAIKFQENKQA